MKWYLGIDPGKGSKDSIGVAVANEQGIPVFFGQYKFDEFVRWLELPNSALDLYQLSDCLGCVYEDYVIFSKKLKQHAGSRVETAQTIGVIRSWAARYGIPLSRQAAEKLSPAQKLFNMPLPEDHDQSHQISALLHLRYWLYTEKKLGQSYLETLRTVKLGEG